MALTKKYALEKINIRRNDIIEISGIIRNMLLILDENIKKKEIFPIRELKLFSDKIVTMRKLIDESNLRIIVDTQLKEDDIRLIIGGMRLISNLEKIGSNIIRITKICSDKEIVKEYDSILTSMVEIIILMFDKVFIAFTYREMEKCYEAIQDDKSLDEIKSEKISAMTEIMMNDEKMIVYGLNVIEIVSLLERTGDYIVNISEDIIYIFSGDDIRYKED